MEKEEQLAVVIVTSCLIDWLPDGLLRRAFFEKVDFAELPLMEKVFCALFFSFSTTLSQYFISSFFQMLENSESCEDLVDLVPAVPLLRPLVNFTGDIPVVALEGAVLVVGEGAVVIGGEADKAVPLRSEGG